MGGNDAGVFEPGKGCPGFQGAIGIEQVLKPDICGADTVFKPVTPHRPGIGMVVELFLGGLEGGVFSEHLLEEPDPVDPRAGLAVREAIQIGAERFAERCEGCLCVG